LGRGLVLFLAEQEGQPIAGALCLRGGDTLYGRYWGGATLPGLHFEACYYQGIEYCLREGLSRFEPGAQGEHKLARGFLPTLVRSRHWVADPEFAGRCRTGAGRSGEMCGATSRNCRGMGRSA
jgi:predicted N-acyltransferase